VARLAGREDVYEVAERFVEEALRKDGSLFTPGSAIWSAENIDDLYERFVGNPIESSDSFEVKFRRQLEGAPAETRQLAAELLYVYLLFPTNISSSNKKRIINDILDDISTEIPNELGTALEHGIANFGPALRHRPWQLTMLLEFFREWKTMPGREEILSDPWRFKELVFSVPHERAGIQREALLHLVHPDTFERSVSGDHKQKIAKHFSYLTSEGTEDIDRRILEIREGLPPEYGKDFDFYQEEVRKRWLPEGRGEEVADAPWWRPLEYPAEVEKELQETFGTGAPHGMGDLLAAIFRRAIILHQHTGIDGFLGMRGKHARVHNVMVGNLFACAMADDFLLLVDNDPDLRNVYGVGEAARSNNELMWIHVDLTRSGLQALLEDESAWAVYERMLQKIPHLSGVRSNHLNVGKLNVITGRRLGAEESRDLKTLSEKLLLDQAYLSRVDRLLRDKRQIIFYGPPGTGKTFVARKLAELYSEGSGGESRLVQFHPSYSYEDFVEGYRPRSVGGQPGFALVDGPLKKLARAASENPDSNYVLVIDEVNRANLTKVLGELYFLLEYRGESVTLQYSGEGFSLPKNLWIICTMNTADRSIALVDAALRRRFYFTPFFPDEAPVAGLLHRWLEKKHSTLLWVADVVDEANRRLGDRQVAIGPSYFLREELTEEWVEIIWEHAVLPYLSEQFFDEEERLEEFDLDRLKNAVAGTQEEVPDETPNPA
jgi:5-methylcytosine-specific restriction protein B